VYVTHDQVEAMAVADKIALLQHGELLQAGSPAEMYKTPMRTEVAEFFGAMNWLAGSLVAPGVAETPIGQLRFSSACSESQVRLGFRPEALVPVDGEGSLTLALSRCDGRGD